ncbi:cytochrome P450 [Pseudonocardiaceae bacterium YIM PH 21723]|nr:cytochrome P450 [Pseudonocardiaceae bacterium YIM PH 21723]
MTDLGCPFDAAYHRDPYPLWTKLREAGPAHRAETPDGLPIWLITRDADVRALFQDERLSVNKAHSRGGYAGFSLPPALDANLMNIDNADHLRLRRLVSQAFTPRRIAELREHIQRHTDTLAEDLPAEAELVADFADPLPLAVIGDLLRIPEPDRRTFSGWTNTMMRLPSLAEIADAVGNLHRYLVDLVADRREHPGDDLLSGLIAARDEQDRLSENELVSMAFLLLLAATENITHLITGGVRVLLRHPEQLAALQRRPELWDRAVEEIFRYVSPGQLAIRRFPLTDIDLHGTVLRAGDTVMLAIGSANRDPARYSDPDRFDIRRENSNTHLSLGHGLHYCLGAALARAQVHSGLSTVFRRHPGLRIGVADGDLMWRTSFRGHALEALPVVCG